MSAKKTEEEEEAAHLILLISGGGGDEDEQCDQIGRFLMTNFLTKVAQMNVDFLSSFDCIHFHVPIYCCGYFLGKFMIILGYFIYQRLVTLTTNEEGEDVTREQKMKKKKAAKIRKQVLTN